MNAHRRWEKNAAIPRWFQILTHLSEDVMAPYRDRGIYVNVDFYAGSIYHLLGIPSDLFIPIFALGRVPGWSAQCIEQYETTSCCALGCTTSARWTVNTCPSTKDNTGAVFRIIWARRCETSARCS